MSLYQGIFHSERHQLQAYNAAFRDIESATGDLQQRLSAKFAAIKQLNREYDKLSDELSAQLLTRHAAKPQRTLWDGTDPRGQSMWGQQ